MTSLKAVQSANATTNRNLAESMKWPRAGRGTPWNRSHVLALVALTLIAVYGLAGCGGGSGGTGPTTVKSVAITPLTITVPLNTTTSFLAVVTLTDSTVSTTTTVSWQVNGVAGGSLATVGSIVPDPDNQLMATYTAPAQVPTSTIGGVTEVGQVAITAVATQTNTSNPSQTPGTVTSNTAIVTVGAGAGLAIAPISVTIPAGGTFQFSALLNGLNDLSAVWTPLLNPEINGSINANGLYTAPSNPPPGGTVTISVTDPTVESPATSIATIVYSDRSLTGPYSFSYTGNDGGGFLAVAGSFVADGNGKILSGVEDIDSFLTGVSTQVSIAGTYVVGPDGRVNARITSSRAPDTWQLALTTSQHAQMTLMNVNATGGGTVDQQNLNALSGSTTVVAGPYVFNMLGADASFNGLGLAGKFTADGSGNIPQTNTILDVNDNGINGGTVTTKDTSLHGTYQFDTVFAGTGRGTVVLNSTTTGSRQYAYYAVSAPVNPNGPDIVTRLHLIEIDRKAFVVGDMYSAPAGPSTLTAGNYVFTSGGNVMVPVSGKPSVLGAYAAGGVFTSNGTTGITGGVFDANVGGTYNSGPAITASSSYSTDATTGRIDLLLLTGTGSSNTNEYAVYQTSQGTALMLQIDANALSTGTAYQQCVMGAPACSTSLALVAGNFALGFTGQGIVANNSSLYQPSASGQFPVNAAITGGNLDINVFGAPAPGDPISTSSSSVALPAANGRGTATLAASNPAATFKLVYYLIDDNTALLFDQDATPIATGAVLRQF
jgi:hypothetical protein